jgi:hypothetical protein
VADVEAWEAEAAIKSKKPTGDKIASATDAEGTLLKEALIL